MRFVFLWGFSQVALTRRAQHIVVSGQLVGKRRPQPCASVALADGSTRSPSNEVGEFALPM